METLKENKAVSKIKHFVSEKQISLDSEILGSKGGSMEMAALQNRPLG